jgi:anaerobic magnesium-protoporphyrin IX monomethyl ester cyclase
MNENVFQLPDDRATPTHPHLATAYHTEPPRGCVDVLLLNPPRPNVRHATAAAPQTSLAQIGALLDAAGYVVEVIDAPGLDMSWEVIERYIWACRPRYLIIEAAAATLTNDMRAALIGKAAGSLTLAFGAHVTPLSRETLAAYPPLDIIVRGEPELTFLDVLQRLDCYIGTGRVMPSEHSAELVPLQIIRALCDTHGVTYRDEQMRARINPDRTPIEILDSLPIPLHDRLPWRSYRHPFSGAPYVCVHTSRGCPASCCFCLKHIISPAAVRHRSAEHVLQELAAIEALSIRYVHFDADLFTVKQQFIYDLCGAMIRHGIKLRWSCNSRVDSVDEVELDMMRQAGCFMIGWAIESGSVAVLRHAGKPTALHRIHEIITASRRLGISNWGYFQFGLPAETTATIQATIAFSKRLPLDRALFRVATPYPGTPFYTEALERGWLRFERWEDYGARTVLSYPHLSAVQLDYWVNRAARVWARRHNALRTCLKGVVRLARRVRSDGDAATLSWSEGGLANASF